MTVVGGGALAIWWFTGWAERQPAADAAATLRLDAIKTALTVAAGLGAGVTLLLALRKQTVNEVDALEQRITTLYVAAADQLGSEKAAVRLAGLYALERLGQNHPVIRQTVVDVVCAYLRMPYRPPPQVLCRNSRGSPEFLTVTADSESAEQQSDSREQLQVRLTAQRLLLDHAQPEEPEMYWLTDRGQRMRLDLNGATLIEFNLSKCEVGRADFHEAQFHGRTSLNQADFRGAVNLMAARFHGPADLYSAQFRYAVDLRYSTFHGITDIRFVDFCREAELTDANFRGNVDFSRTFFHDVAKLPRAQFHGYVDLTLVEFRRYADLAFATFHSSVRLNGTMFRDAAVLNGARFHRYADLNDARFRRSCHLSGAFVSDKVVLPTGWKTARYPKEGLYRVLPDQVVVEYRAPRMRQARRVPGVRWSRFRFIHRRRARQSDVPGILIEANANSEPDSASDKIPDIGNRVV